MNYKVLVLDVAVRIFVVAGVLACLWFTCRVVFGQQATVKASRDRGCFQTLVIKDTKTREIRQFTRHGHKLYGTWIEGTPVPYAIVDSYIVKEWPIEPEEMKKAIGEKLYGLLASNNKVVQSGHFNLSGDPRYDWGTFAGDTYTTRDLKLKRIPVALIGRKEAKLTTGGRL